MAAKYLIKYHPQDEESMRGYMSMMEQHRDKVEHVAECDDSIKPGAMVLYCLSLDGEKDDAA
jgi:hypothetical protein